MQNKSIRQLQGLFAVSLFTFNICGNVHAQESVASYEKFLNDPSTDSASSLPANFDMKQLARELENRGWKVQHESDGSLILSQQKTSGSQAKDNASTKDQWQQLQQKFHNAGWLAEREADGSLRLTPGNTKVSEKPKQASPDNQGSETYSFDSMQKKLKKAGWGVTKKTDGSVLLYPPKKQSQASTDSTSTDSKSSETFSFDSMQQEKLKEAGWGITKKTDGSVLLYPPKKQSQSITASKNSETYSFDSSIQQKLKNTGWDVVNNPDGSILLYPPKKKVIEKKSLPCPGVLPTIAVTLPVDSWQKAHDIAQHWLEQQPIAQVVVGKIRKIFNVYLISVVSSKAPFSLRHQIAIRNHDGAVIQLN